MLLLLRIQFLFFSLVCMCISIFVVRINVPLRCCTLAKMTNNTTTRIPNTRKIKADSHTHVMKIWQMRMQVQLMLDYIISRWLLSCCGSDIGFRHELTIFLPLSRNTKKNERHLYTKALNIRLRSDYIQRLKKEERKKTAVGQCVFFSLRGTWELVNMRFVHRLSGGSNFVFTSPKIVNSFIELLICKFHI